MSVERSVPKDPAKDFGQPVIVVEEFSNTEHRDLRRGLNQQWLISESSGERRLSVNLIITRGARSVDEIWMVTTTAGGDQETALHLRGEEAERLVALIRNNAFDAAGPVSPVARPTAIPVAMALAAAYEREPEVLRALVAADASADDIIALNHRRAVVEEFRRLLEDSEYFEVRRDAHPQRSSEGVWQQLFEANPWLLGLTLSSQLLVGWDPDKLEKVVAGFDVTGPGKRTDAFMKTAGAIQLLTFVEIKRHDTDLLDKTEYRSGAYGPSYELSGAVAQSQTTVQLAQEKIGPILRTQDQSGFDIPGADSYLYRPRSYVIAGHRNEFISEDGGHHRGKIRSFELYRRSLIEPEILTYDEVLARAEALVELAHSDATAGSEPAR